MKTVKWLVLGLLAMSFFSCVLSLLPVFEDQYLVSDPGLVGTWKEDSGADTWTFENAAEKEYLLIQRQVEYVTDLRASKVDAVPGDTARFRARLGRLGGVLFLDFFPADEGNPTLHNDWLNAHLIPAHTLARVLLEKDSLKLIFLDEDWLSKAIVGGEIKLAHVKTENGLVLTASTAELQAFVLKYAEDAAAFPKGPNHADEGIVQLLRVK